MGLDIYFYKAEKTKVEDYRKAVKDSTDKIQEGLPEKEVLDIKEKLHELNPWKEIAYFRKVNFLVYFFDYEDDCSEIPITVYQIKDLIRRCEEVLEDNDKAEDLLPTLSGFFFGSTEYDEYYFEDVENVKNTFSEILDDLKDDEELMMFCWW